MITIANLQIQLKESKWEKIVQFSSKTSRKVKYLSTMPPRPQFTMAQRNFLAFEYHKLKGKKKFKSEILQKFRLKFPGVRVPGTHQMKRIWEKQMLLGTVNNCNSVLKTIKIVKNILQYHLNTYHALRKGWEKWTKPTSLFFLRHPVYFFNVSILFYNRTL